MQKSDSIPAQPTSATSDSGASSSFTLFNAWSHALFQVKIGLVGNIKSLGQTFILITICIGIVSLCLVLTNKLNPAPLLSGTNAFDVAARLRRAETRLVRAVNPPSQITVGIVNATGADLKLRVFADTEQYDKVVQAGHDNEVTLLARPTSLSYRVEPICGDGIIRESRMDSSTSVSKFVDRVTLPPNKLVLRIRKLTPEPILKVRVEDTDCQISESPGSAPHGIGIYTAHAVLNVQVYAESGTKAYSGLRYKTDPHDGSKFIDLAVR